ncbi:MAG: ESPR domain-containing protein, partial [Bradyrhizobium sp.]
MNRIYSVVWSQSLNQLVVASELAAPRGKISGGERKASHPAGTLCTGIMTALLAMGGM